MSQHSNAQDVSELLGAAWDDDRVELLLPACMASIEGCFHSFTMSMTSADTAPEVCPSPFSFSSLMSKGRASKWVHRSVEKAKLNRHEINKQ